MTILVRCLLLAGLVLALAGGGKALAGGDEYIAGNDTQELGPAYFGFARDAKGVPVSDARVVLRPKSGAAVELKTNVLGLYRTYVRKDVNPDEVEVICDKDGYKLARVYRRTPPGSTAMFIETDCTLQRL